MFKINLLSPKPGIYKDKIISEPILHNQGYTFFILKIHGDTVYKSWYHVEKVKTVIRYKEN